MAGAADEVERGEVLVREFRAVRPREDDAAASPILSDERGPARRIELAGSAQSPAWRRDRPGVDGRHRSRQKVDALSRDRFFRSRHVWGRDDVPAGREAREAREDVLGADEAVPAPGQLRREHLVAEIPRTIPVSEDPPRLGVFPFVAERREGDSDLERPAGGGDLPRRVPEEVRGGVLVAVVGDGVVLDAARVGEGEDRRPAVVPGVEDDSAVVRVAAQNIALRERRPDLPRLRVVALERRVEEPVVVGKPGNRPHLRRDVVSRVRLVERLDPGRSGPAGVPEVAVDRDGTRGSGNTDLGPSQIVRR